MACKEKRNQIRITLPLVALCLPIFANYSASLENVCSYDTYLRVNGKCLDISQEGLNDLTEELDNESAMEITQEIVEVNQELEELSQELEELCLEEQPVTISAIEIMQEVCQY